MDVSVTFTQIGRTTVTTSQTVTAPAHAKFARIIATGGGGGGSGGNSTSGGSVPGGSGGHGAPVVETNLFLGTDPTLEITIGAAGTGGADQTAGTSGGTTIIVHASRTIRCVGGLKGEPYNADTTFPSAAWNGYTGNIRTVLGGILRKTSALLKNGAIGAMGGCSMLYDYYNVGNGQDSTYAAGGTGPAGNPFASAVGGGGGASYGAGGNGATGATLDPGGTGGYGAGGGGGASGSGDQTNGGNGGPGIVVIDWFM